MVAYATIFPEKPSLAITWVTPYWTNFSFGRHEVCVQSIKPHILMGLVCSCVISPVLILNWFHSLECICHSTFSHFHPSWIQHTFHHSATIQWSNLYSREHVFTIIVVTLILGLSPGYSTIVHGFEVIGGISWDQNYAALRTLELRLRYPDFSSLIPLVLPSLQVDPTPILEVCVCHTSHRNVG